MLAESWWTEDATSDLWEWSSDELAYGKFSLKSRIHFKIVFSVFTNYRRDGYDLEALFDEGPASSC